MARQPKRWIIYPQAPDHHFARLSHVAPMLVQLLWNRGIEDPGKVEAFLNRETRLEYPFGINGINEAAERNQCCQKASLRNVHEAQT